MKSGIRDWWPLAFIGVALGVAAAGVNLSWLMGFAADLAGQVEMYAVVAVVLVVPVVAAFAAPRLEPSPDRYYWVAIIVLAPVLGPLAFLVFRQVTRGTRRRRTTAIGFRNGSSDPARIGKEQSLASH